MPEEKNKNDEQPHKIETLRNAIFNLSSEPTPKKKHHAFYQDIIPVPKRWQINTISDKADSFVSTPTNTPIFRKFFLFALIFFILSVGAGLYMFLGGGNTVTADNINLSILGNAYTNAGEELQLQVEIANKNAVALDYSDMLITYPRSSASGDANDLVRLPSITLGTIASGKAVIKPVGVTLYGEEGSVQNIHITLEYRVAGSNAIFVKEKDFPVTISGAPLSIKVEGGEQVTSNQPMEFSVSITSLAKKTLPHMAIRIEYPNGFQFVDATPKASAGQNVWQIGDVPVGGSYSIKIKGLMVAQDGEQRSFRIFSGTLGSLDNSVLDLVYSSTLYSVNVVRPFIDARLALVNQDGTNFVANPNDTVRADVLWSNNLPVQLRDVSISAHITGAALDKGSINASSGFYDSLTDTITWSKDMVPALEQVEPGQSGKLSLSFKSYPLLSPGKDLLTKPSVTIELSIQGKRASEGNAVQDISNVNSTTIKFNSNVKLSLNTLRTTGPFANTGPMPPKVGQKTTYTIKLSATNTGNQIENAIVRSSIPSYVTFLGVISPETENLSIDPLSNQLVWRIGTLPAGTGLTTPAKEVYFQVELLPSLSQVGSIPALVGDADLTGLDTWTNATLNAHAASVNTRVFSESTYKIGDERVVE